MSYLVGVDVGGTKAAAVVTNRAGDTVARRWSEHQGPWEGRLRDTVLAAVDGVLADANLDRSSIHAFGIAVAGLISDDQSTVIHSPVLREDNTPVGAPLSAVLGRPVIVCNDANATLYGHSRSRPARLPDTPAQSTVSLLLTLGTGLGGAIMVGDHIVVGQHGFAAELGHVVVDYEDQRVCLCGNRGCVEQFASGRGLTELAAASPPPAGSRMLASRDRAAGPFTSPDIVQAAQTGDPWAVGLLTLCGGMLGRAIAVLCAVLDPSEVIIGGSFGHASQQWLLPAARAEMHIRWPFPADRPLPDLQLDTIGPYAAATGAAMLAASTFEAAEAGA